MAEDSNSPPSPPPIEPPSNNVFQFAATKYSNCTFSIIDHPSYPPLNIKNIPCAPENISRDERILPRNQAQFRWQKTYFLGTLRYFQGTIKYFLGTLLKDSGALIPGIYLPPPRLSSDHLLEPQHHLWNCFHNWPSALLSTQQQKIFARGQKIFQISKGWENIAKKPGMFQMATIYFLGALNYFQETIKYFQGTRLEELWLLASTYLRPTSPVTICQNLNTTSGTVGRWKIFLSDQKIF